MVVDYLLIPPQKKTNCLKVLGQEKILVTDGMSNLPRGHRPGAQFKWTYLNFLLT